MNMANEWIKLTIKKKTNYDRRAVTTRIVKN